MSQDERESNRWNPVEWVRTSQTFIAEVRAEMRKVTWPTQREYVGGTVGVLVIVAVLTIALGVTDFVLARLIQLIVP
jgi:preprotein translocase subunit SecE